MDAGIQKVVIHLDDESADEVGIDNFLEFNGGVSLFCEQGQNLVSQRLAERIGGGDDHGTDIVCGIVELEELVADGVQCRFASLLQQYFQKVVSGLVEGTIEDAFEDFVLLISLDDRIAEQHLQLAVFFQCISKQLEVAIHFFHLILLSGIVEQCFGVAA